jgi:hypothetical protein
MQPIADSMAHSIENISRKFDVLPGVPGFFWNL